MKKIQAARLLHISLIVALLFALVLCTVGITGSYWMKSNRQLSTTVTSHHFGLIKKCLRTILQEECFKRDVLKFVSTLHAEGPSYRDLDVVLAMLIVPIVLGVIAIISALVIIPSKRGLSWVAVSMTVALLCLCGGLVGIGALAYFEKVIANAFQHQSYDHGWSSIVTWGSTIFMLISSVLGFAMACVKPDFNNRGHVVQTMSYSMKPLIA